MADTRTYELTGTRVFRRDTHWGFVTNTGDPMFGSRSPNAALGVDRVRRVRRFRCGTSRVHRRGQIVPLLVNFPLRVGISRLVNSLKSVSSRRLRQEFTGLRAHYRRPVGCGPGSHFAGSVDGPHHRLAPVHRPANRPP